MKAFEDAYARLPEPQRRARADAFEHFRASGLPSRRDEDWKYTDVSRLAERAFVAAAPLQPALPILEGLEQVAFVNGARTRPAASSDEAAWPVPTAADLPDGVTALNAALASDGLDLSVPANTHRAPLHLVTWFGGVDGGMAHLRHRIRLARGATAVVVLHEIGGPSSFFATQILDIELAENSQLALYRVQRFDPGTSAITRIDVRLAGDSRFTCVGFYGGGALARNDLNVSLDAPGAEVELHGVLAPGAGEHLDVHTRLDHRAPRGRSRETFRAIVPAKARAIFNGKVIVHPDAQKTDSEQHVDSLLLAPGAEANAKPELEIYADDVKCAHGATCGQLDEQVIYYLRTRGLPLEAARNVLLYTFAHDVLRRIAFEPARALAEAALALQLPGAALPGATT